MTEGVLVSRFLFVKLDHKQNKNLILSKSFSGRQTPCQARNKKSLTSLTLSKNTQPRLFNQYSGNVHLDARQFFKMKNRLPISPGITSDWSQCHGNKSHKFSKVYPSCLPFPS